MTERLPLYYTLLVPLFLVLLFGPALLQLVFLLFFLLATVVLPREEDFLRVALWKFPAFSVLFLVVSTVLVASFDFVAFLTGLNEYASFLVVLPAYAAFKLLTLPWTFLGSGLAAPLVSFRLPGRDSWLVLAALSALALTYHFFPPLVLFLAAPASYYLSSNLGLFPA